ncbi:hypothetical protein [Nocardia jiangsuensis]|uniref:Seed maturation protein n=1 Tax=Nocardia jiangsuensis TaxID=1691563 RepID=A0ABV8DLJ2_9NOCA
MSPKKQPTAAERARAAAREGDNYTTALRGGTAAADASTGPVASHRNRDTPSEASVISSASSSAQRAGVNSCAGRS